MLPTTELRMQGIYQNNAGRGGKFHYSNKRNTYTRYTPNNKDWRLTQMLDDWENQQEARRKEEALREKAIERKEFTKDLARIIQSKKMRKKKVYSSPESSSSVDSTPRTTPETSPEQEKRKKRKRNRRKSNGNKIEVSDNPSETNELKKTLLDLRSTNEKIHKEVLELRKTQDGTSASIERMELELNTLMNYKEKIEKRVNKLEYQPHKNDVKKGKPETSVKQVNLDSDSETELQEKKTQIDDKMFDLALKFGIATCLKKGDLEKKFEKKPGTTKLKEFCEEAEIKYITKNKAIMDVWQVLLDNNIAK